MFFQKNILVFIVVLLISILSSMQVLAYTEFPEGFEQDKKYIEDLYQDYGEGWVENDEDYEQRYLKGLNAIERFYEHVYNKKPSWISNSEYKEDIQELKGKALDILITSSKKTFLDEISNDSSYVYVCQKVANIVDSYLLPKFVDSMDQMRSSLNSLGDPGSTSGEMILENKKKAQNIQATAEMFFDTSLSFVSILPDNFDEIFQERSKYYKYAAMAEGLEFFRDAAQASATPGTGLPAIDFYSNLQTQLAYATASIDTLNDLINMAESYWEDAELYSNHYDISEGNEVYGVNWTKWPTADLPEYSQDNFYMHLYGYP